MARIVGSAGTINSRMTLETHKKANRIKQIHHANTSITAIENIIQSKKRMMETVYSSYLPNIDAKTMPSFA